MDSRDIALQRCGIAKRLSILALKAHAQPFKKIKVWVVAGQGKNKIVLDRNQALGCLQDDRIRRDLDYLGGEMVLDLSIFNAVFDIRLDPVFDVSVYLRTAMYQCHPSAIAP